MLASKLVDNTIWWEGPTWLSMAEEFWPQNIKLNESEDIVSEKKKCHIIVSNVECSSVHDLMDINRYSSIAKLLRVTAWVLRFIRNARTKNKQDRAFMNQILTIFAFSDSASQIQPTYQFSSKYLKYSRSYRHLCR